MRHLTRPLAFLIVWSLLGSPVCAWQDQSRRTELGERQRLVERKMAELEAKFEIIAHKLESQEPERAKRLVEALQQAKRDLIAVKMAEITALLDENRFQQAEAELDLVIIKLDQLVRLLLNEQEDTLTKQQEIDKLRKWKEELTKIRQEQQQQNRETDKVANKDETLKDLEAQIKAVEALIQKQQSVIGETKENENGGLQALDQVANRQFDVREQTEKLARQISGEPEGGQAVSTDGEAIPQTGNSGNDSKPTGDQPVDPASEPTDQPGNPGDQPADPSSSDSSAPMKPPGNEPASGDGSSSTSSKPKQPAQQPLENAAGNQKQAEQKLTTGKAIDAIRSEEKALSDLENALAELRKEQRRIASLPPEAFQEMARQQRQTEKKTADLSRDMEQTPKSGSPQDPEGEPSSNGQQQQGQPGQQSVGRAQKAMQNAAGDLNDEEPQKASRQQDKAIEELDKALREIEERLDQLREETREEKLARLEARFREMLTRQQIATVVTMDLDEKKTHLNRVRRRDVLAMLRLGNEEREISELGQQAYDLLLEDGTSIVFPEMVQVIREDLERVAQMLESEQTGPLTQLVQREIESSLEELLEALKKTRQEGQAGGGGGGGGNQPLLRKSAELKMLRSAQLRVNRLTKQFDLIRGSDKLVETLQGELNNIRVRQADIVEMMIRIMEKQE